jgi:hypothetical protein
MVPGGGTACTVCSKKAAASAALTALGGNMAEVESQMLCVRDADETPSVGEYLMESQYRWASPRPSRRSLNLSGQSRAMRKELGCASALAHTPHEVNVRHMIYMMGDLNTRPGRVSDTTINLTRITWS